MYFWFIIHCYINIKLKIEFKKSRIVSFNIMYPNDSTF